MFKDWPTQGWSGGLGGRNCYAFQSLSSIQDKAKGHLALVESEEVFATVACSFNYSSAWSCSLTLLQMLFLKAINFLHTHLYSRASFPEKYTSNATYLICKYVFHKNLKVIKKNHPSLVSGYEITLAE